MLNREQITNIIAEHWVVDWNDPRYPTSVRCMGCDWEGRFPGDIAEHCAELIIEAEQEDRRSRSRYVFEEVRAKFIAGGGQ